MVELRRRVCTCPDTLDYLEVKAAAQSADAVPDESDPQVAEELGVKPSRPKCVGLNAKAVSKSANTNLTLSSKAKKTGASILSYLEAANRSGPGK